MAPSLEGIVGAYIIGTVLETILFGANFVSATHFFTHSSWETDKRNRLLVLFIGLVSLLESSCVLWTIWSIAVEHFGDLEFFCQNHTSIAIGPSLNSTMSFCVQAFYANRVYLLGRKKNLVPGIIMLLACAQFGFGVSISYMEIYYGSFDALRKYAWGVEIWRFASILADVVITVSLIRYLRTSKSFTDFDHTKSMLDKVIASTLENNSITCVTALLAGVLFVAQTSSWYLIFGLPLGKLYFASMLASLNNRQKFAAELRIHQEQATLQFGIGNALSVAGPIAVTMPGQVWRRGSAVAFQDNEKDLESGTNTEGRLGRIEWSLPKGV